MQEDQRNHLYLHALSEMPAIFVSAQVAMLREKDLLTRLLNRNSYENKIKVYARRPHQGLICIYEDMETDCTKSTTRWDMKPEPVY